MIIGYLIPGLLVAALSAVMAVLSGYGFLAALGLYILIGSATTVVTFCASLCYRMLYQPEILTLENAAFGNLHAAQK